MKYSKQTVIVFSTVVVVLLLALTAAISWGLTQRDRADEVTMEHMQAGHMSDTGSLLESHGIEPLDQAAASNKASTEAELAYLLEEEKLAHDVYVAMYDKWGSRVFSNISGSEQMHQNMVLAVMQSRGIADSRTTEPGVFVNTELQSFYDDLIAQGNKSEQDAFRAAVKIEETDIADLQKTQSGLDPKDTDIDQVLNNLLHSSENHLRAFTRQLER